MEKQLKLLYRLAIIVLFLTIGYFIFLMRQVFKYALSLLWFCAIPFFISAFISYLLHPVIIWLEKKKLKKEWAIIIWYSTFFTLLFFLIYKGIPIFIDQFKIFAAYLPKLAHKYDRFICNYEKFTVNLPFDLHYKLDHLIEHHEKNFTTQMFHYGKHLGGVSDFLLIVSTVPFITFYILRDYLKIGAYLLTFIPPKWQKTVKAFIIDLDVSLGAYIRGQLLLSLLIFLMTFIIFTLIKMEYSLILSIIIGLTNVIPTFGPLIGAVPALIVAVTISKIMIVKVLITIVLLQLVEGNWLAPLIMGKSLKIHALAIVFALLIGEAIGGILGLIFSVPIFAIIKIAYKHIKQHNLFRKKN